MAGSPRRPAAGTPVAGKLGVDGDVVFTVVGAPDGFAAVLGDHGHGVWQQSLLAPLDVVIGFFARRERLLAAWPKLTDPVTPAGAVWVAWPKPGSGVATDLSADVLRSTLLASGWADTKVCAVDDVWSAIRFELREDRRPGARATKRPRDRVKR